MRWLPVLLAVLTTTPTLADTAKPPIYPDRNNLLIYRDGDRAVPVRTPNDWQKRREHVLAAMQLVMGPLPPESRKVALELKVEQEETLPKVIRRRVSFLVEK